MRKGVMKNQWERSSITPHGGVHVAGLQGPDEDDRFAPADVRNHPRF
jgi:hypothetical protein